MKKIGILCIGVLCTLILGIQTWREHTLHAFTNLEIRGAVVLATDENGTSLLPNTTNWKLYSDELQMGTEISRFEFYEVSNTLFHGMVMNGTLTDFNPRLNDVPSSAYVVRVGAVFDNHGGMIRFNEDLIAGLNVVNYHKAASGYTIELGVDDVTQPTGYGSLTCWTNDTSKCDLLYQSKNESIATVSSTGQITGIAEGSTGIDLYLKASPDTFLLETIPVTVTSEQEPVIDFAYVALQPELKEGEIAAPTKIGTLSVTPADADISGYTFEIDGDAHLSIQNQEVFIATDIPANTYTYHVVVKKEGVEVFRSTSQTVQVLEPDPIPTPDPTPDPDQGTDPTPDPTPDPDQGTDPDPAPTITFSYNSIITSLEEGYSAQKIGSIQPSIQGSYYYEVSDASPIIEVEANGDIQIKENLDVDTYTFHITVYSDAAKTQQLQELTGNITISEAQTPIEEPFQFVYEGTSTQPNAELVRTYDPDQNSFTLATNKEGVSISSLQMDVLTIQGTTATIHKACPEGVNVQAEYQGQTYQVKIKINKASQAPVHFAKVEIDIAYGTLAYDPVFSGGSGTGAYELSSSDPAKITVAQDSSSTLHIQEGAVGDVYITLVRKGDENYLDSTSTAMLVHVLAEEETPPPSPDDDPDEEQKQTMFPSTEEEGTLIYTDGLPKQAKFQIKDITQQSKDTISLPDAEKEAVLVYQLSLTDATLTRPAQIKLPLRAMGSLREYTFFYEQPDGSLKQIQPVLAQDEITFDSDYMGKLIIAKAKETEKQDPPAEDDPNPTTPDEEKKDDKTDDKQEPIPVNPSPDNQEPTPTNNGNSSQVVNTQGVVTGDSTNYLYLGGVVVLTALVLILLLRRRNKDE